MSDDDLKLVGAIKESEDPNREEAIEATADIVIPDEETVSEDEAEEFANKIIRRAASLRAVKIDRDVFLRTELKKRCPNADIERALETTLAEAGVPAEVIDEIARSAVDFETKKVRSALVSLRHSWWCGSRCHGAGRSCTVFRACHAYRAEASLRLWLADVSQ